MIKVIDFPKFMCNKKKKFIVNLHHHLVFHRPTPQVAFDYVGIEFFSAALLSTSATLLYTWNQKYKACLFLVTHSTQQNFLKPWNQQRGIHVWKKLSDSLGLIGIAL